MIKTILTISLFVANIYLFGQTKEIRLTGEWLYCDKYTFKFLSICDDNTFFWRYSSCTSSYSLSGLSKLVKDTIVLTGVFTSERSKPRYFREKTEKFIFRKNRIYTYADSNNIFDDFESLTKTIAKNIFEAEQICIGKRIR